MREPRGNLGIMAGVLLGITLTVAAVGFAPISRCPLCPFIKPRSFGCSECDDRTRVSPYGR